jgi:release factor glutamine methyltransferase
MATVQELLRAARELPGESPGRDVEVLLGHCLGRPRAWLYAWPEAPVEGEGLARFESLLAQRRRGVPVAYLTGRREFWTLELAVDRHTLIPRPETESLVEWALALANPAQAAVLDLGTGSGAIALALASERPRWRLTAVDASEVALGVARANATRLGLQRVEFLLSDWYRAVAGRRFHLLLANPPYVGADDPHLAQGDLRFEPRAALVAPEEGMADLARLVRGAPAHLHPGGHLLLEHGCEQGEQVRRLLLEAGFSEVETRLDMAGRERVSGGRRRAQ